MYWIPAIFILCEIIFLLNIPTHLKTLAFNAFLEKIKKEREKEERVEKLKTYQNPQNWSNIGKTKYTIPLPELKKGVAFFGFYYLALLIYFIVGLFYPIWWLSVIIFASFIVSVLFSRIFFGTDKDDMFLDYNDFDDNIIPQKMERKIKLSNIDNNYHNLRKIVLTKEYLFSLIRLSVSVAVIVLHQYGMV